MPAPTYPGSNRPRNPAGPPPIPANTVQSLPPVKYFDNNMLRPALLDEEAEQVGRKLAEEKLERTQLRRFYNDVLSLKRRFEMETVREKAKGTPSTADEIFRRIEPELRLLRAKAYYANRRKVLPDIMKTFIDQHIRKISGAKDFQAFCKHFEAVVAFHYAYSKESRKEAEE